MRKLPLILLFTACAAAQEVPPQRQLESVPDGSPSPASEGGPIVPEITIRRTDTDVTREYRYGGRLYMVEIVPSMGPPYYLVDTDGDGNLETHYSELDPRIVIPAWVLLRW